MASYYQADNKKWYVRFRVVENGSVVNKKLSGFDTKKQAVSAYNDYISKTDLSQVAVVKPSQITFEQLFESYKDYYRNELKGSAYITFVDLARLYIVPYFANINIHKIAPIHISTWKNTINNMVSEQTGKPFSWKYKDNIFTTLVHILNYGKRFYSLNDNVASRVGNFKDKDTVKKEMLFWEPNEFKQFISVADNNMYKTLFIFLYLTGCRKGEMCALQWKDIDLDKKVVRIYKTVTRKTLDGSPYAITPPKSINSTRTIHLSDLLCKQLLEYRSSLEDIDDEDFIFGGSRPIAYTNITTKMNAWIKNSGVKKIRVHDIRHSHVSFLIHASKRPSLSLVYIIANRIGDRPEEVMTTYGHMFPNDQAEIIAEIEQDVNSLFGA